MNRPANKANGSSYPLGSVVYPDGVNFSVFSKNATAMELLLFDNADHIKPSRVIRLSPKTNNTYHYWHVFVGGSDTGRYMVTVHTGPPNRARGSGSTLKKSFLILTQKRCPCPRAMTA